MNYNSFISTIILPCLCGLLSKWKEPWCCWETRWMGSVRRDLMLVLFVWEIGGPECKVTSPLGQGGGTLVIYFKKYGWELIKMKHRFSFSWGERRARSEVDLRLNLGLVRNWANMGPGVHPVALQKWDWQRPLPAVLGDEAKSFPCSVPPVSRSFSVNASSLSFFLHAPRLFCFSPLPSFSSSSPTFPKEIFFSTLFFRGFSFAGWCHRPSLLWIEPFWSRQSHRGSLGKVTWSRRV